jgi:PAS domain S-box-containing protein
MTSDASPAEEPTPANSQSAAPALGAIEREAVIREALLAAGTGTWYVDVASGDAQWDDITQRILGLPSGTGRGPLELLQRLIHPDDIQDVQSAIDRARETRTSYIGSYRIKRPDGVERWIASRGRFFYDAEERPVRAAGTLTDVTDRVEAARERQVSERERARLEEQLRQTQKLESLGVLAGGIAHDMNNLLVPILGNASIARSSAVPGSELEATIADIEIAAQRAAELTRQLLAYSGKGRFVVQPVDLSSLVREMTALLQTSIPKVATLRLDLADGLPPIQGDATQLRQVVMNLLTNAADALDGKAGAICLSTGTVRSDESELSTMYLADALPPGECVYLDVSDSGCGMTPDTLRRIFDPFFTTNFTGRGLGLAATLGIMRSHRGAVRVDSTVGEGSTFRVLFPAADVVLVAPVKPSGQADHWRGAGTILVVDDERPVRVVAGRMARRVGFDVIEAADGEEALEMFVAHRDRVRLVLLDLNMPRKGGEAVAAELAEIAPDVRIVLTSGFTEHDVRALVGQDGIVAFVGKPFIGNELIAAFRAALD